MRTEFTLSDKLLIEPTTEEEERLSKFELEVEIQRKIVDASLKLLNELNHKRKVRKQRRTNYEDALKKLQFLEKKLLSMKQQIAQENQQKYQSKKRLIEQHLPPPTKDLRETNGHHPFHPKGILANTFGRSIPINSLLEVGKKDKQPLTKAGRKRHEAFHKREQSYSHPHQPSQSVPSSPIAVQKEYRVTPLSPVELQQELDNETFLKSEPPAVKAPASSTVQPILKTPITPTSILKKGGKTRQSERVKKGVTIGEDVVDFVGELTRSNSAENVRRKSYVHAVNSPPTAPSFNGRNYYNNSFFNEKNLPKNPPPPVPHHNPSVNMAKRPLPPTPSSFAGNVVSLTDALQLENRNQVPSQPYSTAIPRSQRSHHQPERSLDETATRKNGQGIDISSRAVRSSVVRTNAGITISTTSSADAGVVSIQDGSTGNQSLNSTPVPSPLPSRKPAIRSRAYSGSVIPDPEVESVVDSYLCPSPTPSSASTMAMKQAMAAQNHSEYRHQPDIYDTCSSLSSMGPPTNLPPRKPKSNASGSMNRQQKPPPLNLDPNPGQSQHVARSVTPLIETETDIPGLDQDVFDNELIPPQSPFVSQSRPCVETPRPDPIPISPQINVSEGVVDVISVGTYTPYWEENKPFEMSDFLKYSSKHRKKTQDESSLSNAPLSHPAARDTRTSESSETASQSVSTTLSPTASFMDTSFVVSSISGELSDEMLDWYDRNVKNGTVV
jgi:hypothetical protein